MNYGFFLIPTQSAVQYITSTGRLFYDFQAGTTTESLITQASDLSPSALHLVRNTGYYPKIDRIQSGYNLKYCLRTKADTFRSDVMLTATNPNSIFNSSFRILFTIAFQDFQVASTTIFGVQDAAFNNGIQLSNNNGVIAFRYAAGGNGFTFTAPSALLYDGQIGETLFDIETDFTTDICKVYINGVNYSFTITAGSVASVDPATFTVGTNKLCIGGHNNNGAIATSNTAYQYFMRFLVTPIVSGTTAGLLIPFILSTTSSGAVVTTDSIYAITPYTHAQSGGLLWLDCTDLASLEISSGTSVVKIKDKGGLYNFYLGSNFSPPPAYTTGGRAGNSYLDFDGANNYGAGQGLFTEFSSLTGMTCFLICDAPMQTRLIDSSGTQSILMGFDPIADGNDYTGVQIGSSAFGAVTKSTGFHCMTLRYDGTQSTNATKTIMKIDNVQKTLIFTGTQSSTTGNAISRAAVAALYAGTFKNNGNLYEWIVIPKLLTTQQESDFYNGYIKPKYLL